MIHTFSLQYVWDNVYDYDKDFRIHMHRYPDRNWSVILQQAWMMRLQEKLGSSSASRGLNSNQGSHKKNSDACRRYNRGKCTFGNSCKYDHKCQYCNHFGHPISSCRKLAAERTEKVNKTDAKPNFSASQVHNVANAANVNNK